MTDRETARTLSVADPGPLGLAAFALTTFVLSVVNAGLVPSTFKPVVLGVALFYGGIAQLLAGLMEYLKRNTFGGTAFCSYGGFWLSFWYISTNPQLLAPAGADAAKAVGLYLLGWTIFTALMTVAVQRVNGALFGTFCVLLVAFVCLTAGDLFELKAMTVVGGFFGLAAAAGAWYTSFAGVLASTAGRPVLPVWPRGAAH